MMKILFLFCIGALGLNAELLNVSLDINDNIYDYNISKGSSNLFLGGDSLLCNLYYPKVAVTNALAPNNWSIDWLSDQSYIIFSPLSPTIFDEVATNTFVIMLNQEEQSENDPQQAFLTGNLYASEGELDIVEYGINQSQTLNTVAFFTFETESQIPEPQTLIFGILFLVLVRGLWRN
jgi:hypothetical protein